MLIFFVLLMILTNLKQLIFEKILIVGIYKNIVRFLVWHIKFEKRKALKKKDNQRINAYSMSS